MTIQVLHYEFMGPIRLAEWGPPMEEVVYVLLARDGDKFSLIYADQCSRSDDAGFFTKSPRFKCWISHAGTEDRLYVAVHPMFGSPEPARKSVVRRIVSKYSPPCNAEQDPRPPPAGGGGGETETGGGGPPPPPPDHGNTDAARKNGDPVQAPAPGAPPPGGQDPGATGGIRCACCGAEMRLERQLRRSDMYRCGGCGISDTRAR